MRVIAIVAAAMVMAGSAHAQANRTFVSGFGSDSNPCSLGLPCRSFAHAITVTNASGEITVLDSAGYGSVTINKSISITNEQGVEAGVTTATAVDAIVVNIGASDVVNLQGLTLVGGGVGTNGINFTGGGTLNIQNTVIRGFTGNGMAVTATSAQIAISDALLSANQNGISFTGGGTLMAERVQATGNSNIGVDIEELLGSPITGTCADCVAAQNDKGFFVGAPSPAGPRPQFTIFNGKIAHNRIGLFLNNSGVIFLSQSMILNNASTAYTINGASPDVAIVSFGNNSIAGSSTGTLDSAPQK